MATQTITYTNKVDLYTDSSIADINKVKASDMNEIKGVVNNNAGELGTLQTTVGNIIDSGTNNLGTWIKYIDGTMICTKKINKTVTIDTGWGSMYESQPIDLGNYAQTFISVPIINVTVQNDNNTAGILEFIGNPTTQSIGKVILARATTTFSQQYAFHVIAIGRWK